MLTRQCWIAVAFLMTLFLILQFSCFAQDNTAGKSADQKNLELSFLDAIFKIMDKKHDEAMSIYDQILASGPNNALAITGHGWALFESAKEMLG